MDIFAASEDDDTVALYLNDGSENSTQQIITDSADKVLAASQDIDGDGDLDISVGSLNDGVLAWYEQGPSLTFTQHVIANLYSSGGVKLAKALDVDGDGDLDVLAATGQTLVGL